MTHSLAALVVLAGALPAAFAQTGPWSEGELLVRTVLQPSGQTAIVRVDPASGASAVLAIPLYWGGWSGSMVFDAHRGGVLANISLPPDNPFLYRLWFLSQDGSAAAMPGIDGSLRALASAGDGRVFFIRHLGMAQGPKPIEYFDANDQIQTLMQADGVTPYQIEVEHLLYHAPSNALIGSSSKWWSSTHCGTSSGPSVYRIPLSADGLRVEGPTTCTDIESFGYGEIMGLDHLPNGKVLASNATGWAGAPRDVVQIDPSTLATTTLVEPLQGDIDGGVWSAPLGRVILHTSNAVGQVGLFSYLPGSSGWGSFIPTSIPLSGSGGFSPAETMVDVDVNGPACDGFQIAYGAGLAGASGITPLIGAIGCPDVGSPFTLSITAVLGGAPGLLAVGSAPLALPVFGGTLHVLPTTTLPIVAVGAPGVPGAGSLAAPITFNDPSLVGIDLYLQAAFLDAAAVQAISMTNGLRLQAG